MKSSESQKKNIMDMRKTDMIELVLSEIGNDLDDAKLPYYDYLYLGIEEINNLIDHEEHLIEKIEKSPYKTEFEPEASKRSFFKMLQERVSEDESVLLISVALPYPKTSQINCKSEGLIDGSSFYYDYHQILKESMRCALENISKKKVSMFSYYDSFVDTSDYIDRELAFLCGLGTYGKNHMLIHSELGSQFHIGHMYMILKGQVKAQFSKVMTSDELESNRLYERCEGCNKCILACPSKICGTPKMNRLKCVSYLTQTKKVLTTQEMSVMANRLYGCDICQSVCPANNFDAQKINPLSIVHWQSRAFEGVAFFELFSMSQKSFKRQYGDRGFAWRGLKIFKRNALISIGNADDSILSERVSSLKELEENPSLKPYYEYAIKKIKSV